VLQWERLQQLHRTGQGDDSIGVGDLTALDFAVFRVVIGVGDEFANGSDAGPAMRLFDNFIGVETVFVRPPRPNSGDCRRGIHKDAIQIEKHTAATDTGHDS
jgi:hypothetical protein